MYTDLKQLLCELCKGRRLVDQDNDSLISEGRKGEKTQSNKNHLPQTNAHPGSEQFLMNKMDKDNFLSLKNTSRCN